MKNLFKKILQSLFIGVIFICFFKSAYAVCYTQATCTIDMGINVPSGTYTITPGCNGASPSNYTYSLSVNGVTVSGPHDCPTVNIWFSFLQKFQNSLNTIFATVKNFVGVESAFAEVI